MNNSGKKQQQQTLISTWKAITLNNELKQLKLYF